jgi:hypothetical protein
MAPHTVPLAQAYAEALAYVRDKVAREGETVLTRYSRDTATLVLLLGGAKDSAGVHSGPVVTARNLDRALYHWRLVRRILRYTTDTPTYTRWFSWSTLTALRENAAEVVQTLDRFNHLVAQAQKCLAQERST